jgi:hypothetical protein
VAGLASGAVGGLTTAALDALTTAQVGALTSTQIDGLSPAQIAALGTDLSSLSTAAMASIDSGQAAAITSSQLSSFDAADIAALATGAVGALTTAALVSLETTQLAALTTAQVGALTSVQVLALTGDQLTALNTAGLLDDISHPLSENQITSGLGLTALDTAAKRSLFNSYLIDVSSTSALNLSNKATAVKAVVAAANGGDLTLANLTDLGVTGATTTNHLAGIRAAIDLTANDGTGVDTMAELRGLVGLHSTINSAAATYSLRKVDADYTGNAIRVRRSNDNDETDIGFTASGDLDTAALLAHVGSGNGFVTTWYDQSGTGRNATQTTAEQQPRIVSNGAMITEGGRPAVLFDGVNDFLSSFGWSGLISGLSGLTVSTVIRGTSGPLINTTGNNGSQFSIESGGAFWVNNGGKVDIPFTANADIQNYTFDAGIRQGHRNGVLLQQTTAAPNTINTFSDSTIDIGRRSWTPQFLNANVSELLLVRAALSTTDRQTLEINQGLYYDISVSAGLFGLWQSDGAGGSGTATTTNLLQTWSAQLVSHASQTNDAGTFNGSAPLSQYINRVTGTDVVSAAEFQNGFTITGKAAAGATNIRFYLDNDRTNGTDEIGTQLTNGSNGVTWTYDNTTGDYTITFAAGSTALKKATHNTHGSGVHKISVDASGDGVMQAGEASRLFLVASGTAQTTDTGQVGQNYSVRDRPTGNVFVYYYGDPDGNGIGLWTRLDDGDTAANPGTALTNRDGATLNSIVDWDYYATGITAGTQATTANTALGFVTSIAAQVWEFQMGQSSASDQTWSAARTWAGDHTARGSNTSRMASLAETLALYAANFGGSGSSVNTVVGAVEAMSNLTSTTTAAGENNAPGGWTGTNIWTAAPTPSGNAVVSLTLGHVLDELGSAVYRVSAVL